MRKYNKLPARSALLGMLAVDTTAPSGLRWRVRARASVPAGTEAGSQTKRGYWNISIQSKLYLAHRLVFFMETGADPGCSMVDHIDTDPSNNRIENLRLVNNKQNRRNVKHAAGVRPTSRGGRWESVYTDESGARIYLGTFNDRYIAELARDAYVRKAGCSFTTLYHPATEVPQALIDAGRSRNAGGGALGLYGVIERDSGRYRATICVDRKNYRNGTHGTIDQAKRAVDELIIRHGKDHPLYFPLTPTE